MTCRRGRSAQPGRHPDFLGPDDMRIKIEELREATDWQVPIFVKMGASRVFDDVKLAAKAGADVVVVDGMEGGTGASPEILQEHTGIPTLAAVVRGAGGTARTSGLYGDGATNHCGRHSQRRGRGEGAGARRGRGLCRYRRPDRAELQQAALCGGLREDRRGALPLPPLPHRPLPGRDHHAGPGADEAPRHRRGRGAGRSFFRAMTGEIQMLARACGKSHVHHLEPEDLRALTMEASLITGVPLAGTNRVIGGGPGW